MFLPRTILIALLVVVSFGASAHAENTKVGVIVSAVINGNADLGQEVSESLASALSAKLLVTVVAGPKAEALLPAEARDATCIGNTQCLIAAGKALNVDQLLMLIIVATGEDATIEATWVNVATGESTLRSALTVPKYVAAMVKAFEENVQSLLPDVGIRPPSLVNPIDIKRQPDQPKEIKVQQESSSSLNKTLLITGIVGLGGALTFGSFRRIECGSFFNCDDADERPVLSATADILGIIGVLSLTTVAIFHFSGDSEEASSVQVSGAMTSQSASINLWGYF